MSEARFTYAFEPPTTLAQLLYVILQVCSPLKVVLFGSRARGDFDAESDYDVLVVVSDETDVRTTKRQLQQALAAQPSPVQLLVKRWSDYLALQGLTVGLWQNIRTDGITLYERTDITHFTPFPMKTNQDLAQTLLKKAQTDLKSARILSEHLTEIEAIGFHCQQAVEKALKAVLAHHDIHFPRTHDLGELLRLLAAHNIPYDPALNEATQLTDFAVELRYDTLETTLDIPSALNLATTALAFAERFVAQ